MKIRQNIAFLLILLFVGSCTTVELLDEVDPNEISRVVGPEGGTITFYSGSLPQDLPAAARVLAILEIPPNAVDEEVIFSLEGQNRFLGNPPWTISPSIEFNEPVRFSYRVEELDSTQTDAYCYYRPYRYTEDNDTLQIDDFEFDPISNLVTIETTEISGFYDYVQSLEFSFRANTFFFCSSTNQEFLELNLTSGNSAFGNLLFVPKNGIIPPGYVSAEPVAEFPETVDPDFRYAHVNEPLEIGNITALPLNNPFGNIFSVDLVNVDPDNPATLFLQVDELYPYNVRDELANLGIYRLDLENNLVLEEYTPNIVRENPYIFSTIADTSGVYLIGLPTEDFMPWTGGNVNVTAEGPTTIDLSFNAGDYCGAEVFCRGNECIFNILVNRVDGPKEESDEYIALNLYYSEEFNYMEVTRLDRIMWYRENGVRKGLQLNNGPVDSFTIERIDDDEIGGELIGSFTTSGIDEGGNDYTFTIDFELRVYRTDVQ